MKSKNFIEGLVSYIFFIIVGYFYTGYYDGFTNVVLVITILYILYYLYCINLSAFNFNEDIEMSILEEIKNQNWIVEQKKICGELNDYYFEINFIPPDFTNIFCMLEIVIFFKSDQFINYDKKFKLYDKNQKIEIRKSSLMLSYCSFGKIKKIYAIKDRLNFCVMFLNENNCSPLI